MFHKTILHVALGAFALQATGCMTILNGTSQDVSVVTYPIKTNVRVVSEGGELVYEGPAPAEVKLKRSQDYEITASAPGYRPAKLHVESSTNADNIWSYVLLNMFFSFGVGHFIDPFTGSLSDFDKEGLEVTLLREKTAGAQADDMQLRVTGDVGPDGQPVLRVSAAQR